ncbi:hypothetical protein BD779DRAFT_1683561 [Infundibulicybe gibba]|nr:hypothetical protein BD779DRAFT_1683561 [Infundibulicybe gibba]
MYLRESRDSAHKSLIDTVLDIVALSCEAAFNQRSREPISALLELPHISKSNGRGSGNREAFQDWFAVNKSPQPIQNLGFDGLDSRETVWASDSVTGVGTAFSAGVDGGCQAAYTGLDLDCSGLEFRVVQLATASKVCACVAIVAMHVSTCLTVEEFGAAKPVRARETKTKMVENCMLFKVSAL